MTDFLSAAHRYFDEQQWTCIPLILDDNGFPKRPFSNAWQLTTSDWDTIRMLPWHQARGLGIVLGERSDNLAVLDLDSVPFADAVLEVLRSHPDSKFYQVRTVRGRGHLYFREGMASGSNKLTGIRWRGETFDVELKANGTQVAAPPTPGYSFVGTSTTPTPVGRLSQAWEAISQSMGVEASESQHRGSSGYPSPWKETLSEGERNNAVYVEACRLAEAKMPLDAAISTMLVRVKQAYQGTVDEYATIRTIRSAYHRVLNPRAQGRGGVAL